MYILYVHIYTCLCTYWYVHVYTYTYKSAPNRVCGLVNSQKLNVLVQPMAKSETGTLGAPGSLSSCNLRSPYVQEED